MKIGNRRAEIEMLGGKKQFFLDVKSDEIPSFQREILMLGAADIFLPMSFLLERGICRAYYDFSGCIPLSEHLSTGEGRTLRDDGQKEMTVMGSLIGLMKEAEDHLLFTGDYALELGGTFFHPQSEKVYMAFLPSEKETPFSKALCNFLEQIEEVTRSSSWQVLSLQLRGAITEENLGLNGILELLYKMGFSNSKREGTA